MLSLHIEFNQKGKVTKMSNLIGLAEVVYQGLLSLHSLIFRRVWVRVIDSIE